VLLALSGLAPAFLDMLTPARERSHIGAAADALLSGKGGMLADTMSRKVAMNFGVIGAAPWVLLLVVVAAAAAWAALRRGGPGRLALAGQRALSAGIAGAVAAGVVATVVNDSGLIAGAGAFVVALSAVLFLAARAREEMG
jgi:hypothetical protein